MKPNKTVKKGYSENRIQCPCGSIYNFDTLKEWGVEKFDVVMGNPPYNSGGIKHYGDKNLYVFFSIKGIDLLRKGGYLVFIHPPTYRISEHKIKGVKINLNEIYTSKQIKFIRMYSIMQTKKIMDVMTNVDYIILKNEENDNKSVTTIIDTTQREYKVIITPNYFIPNYGINILLKLKKNANKSGNVIIISSSENHSQNTIGNKHKNVHGLISNGIKICMSTKPHSLNLKKNL